ncbi:hypothetical protein AC579_5166 [Pseudocercospora musae]|uniref:Ankyrin repeat protein n=1 Tax=Pseudocercospora musae TaxID=113226 RepID=A0A139HZS7_9PEZI|nr:hypothetical protein AC579_5166 [Pseudocercospora musae]
MDAATAPIDAREKIKSGEEAALGKIMQQWSAVVAEPGSDATECGSDYWELLLEAIQKDTMAAFEYSSPPSPESPKVAAWLLERGSDTIKNNGQGRTVLDIIL